MGASCTVQGWKPIREEDIITKVRYEKPLGDISGNELTAQRESINAELLTIKAELIKMVSAIDGGEDNEQI